MPQLNFRRNSPWISLSCTLKAEPVPVIHWIGGWTGSTACLNAVGNRQISCSGQESNYDSEVVQTELSHYTVT
jgi:hypothetical protein